MANLTKCRDCGELFAYYHGKPGYINQCLDCATDVPIYIAEEGSDDTGVVEHLEKGSMAIEIRRAFRSAQHNPPSGE